MLTGLKSIKHSDMLFVNRYAGVMEMTEGTLLDASPALELLGSAGGKQALK